MEERSPNSPTASQMSRRATWFVSALVVLVLIGAVILAYAALDAAKGRIRNSLEHGLALPVQNRSASVTVWYGSLQADIERLAQTDTFRLLASEVQSLGESGIKTMLSLSGDQQTSPADSGDVERLASQLPLLRAQLEQLVERRGDTLSATLLTPDMHPYLGTGVSSPDEDHWKERLTDDVWPLAKLTVEEGKMQVSAVRRQGPNRLIMRVACPLFAPEYIAQPGNKPVGVLVVSCNVTPTVRSVTLPRGFEQSGQSGYLLQKTSQGLELLLPDGDEAPFILPGWSVDEFGELPLASYMLADKSPIYALGQSLPGLPWIVVQDVLQETVAHTYDEQRSSILFTIAACTAIALLVIGMFWWWFVGRRERAVAGELKKLYHTVNQQHQLLHGINSSMADGIMMLDREGIVQYTNEAFAAMAGKGIDDMIGHSLSSSFGKQAAERIIRHAGQVLRGGKVATFNEELALAKGRRNLRIACSPFQQEDGAVTGVVAVFQDMTDLVQAQRRAQAMVHQTINVLVRAIEAVDPYLRGQSMHTGLLAAELARTMHLGAEDVTTVRTAASLSQIGMIQLPRELVNKTSALTPEERQELEQHVEYAKSSLEGIDFGLPVQEAIYQMHEHSDGSGYPRRLQGEDISLNARVLGVANTFCALVRPRSYRQAHAVEGALEILSVQPPQYDPAVVQALRSYLATPQGEEFLSALQHDEVGE